MDSVPTCRVNRPEVMRWRPDESGGNDMAIAHYIRVSTSIQPGRGRRRDPRIAHLALGIEEIPMIRKLAFGQYRVYSRKKDPHTGKRRNLGTFGTKKAAQAHERAVQYFKHQ